MTSTSGQADDILIQAMDRESGERREFRLDRLITYSIHRTSYLVPRPVTAEPKKRPGAGFAAATVRHSVDCPIARRVQILADALTA